MIVSRTGLISLVAATMTLAACSSDPPTDSTAAAAAAPVAMELGPTLLAYRWRLESAADAAGESIASLFPGPENRLGLEFSDGRVGVTGGCNRMSAAYQVVEAARLQLVPGPATLMACPPPLAAADSAIAGFLTGTLQAELRGDAGAPLLQLTGADGSVLDFTGTPTPETRFGGPGTRAFLEVSTEACDAPHDASAGCLKVRDRHFDEQGLRVGEPGEWRALPGGIEGYAPTPGQQQVVRVKRFETTGDEPTVHFVFDMVVESRTIQ